MKALGIAALFVVCCVAVAVAWTPGYAAQGAIDSVFHLKRSINKNEVHYKALMYDDCTFRSTYPVRGYWRNFEEDDRGPTSELLGRELPYYGVTLASRKYEGTDRVVIHINAFSDRRITVRSRVEDGRCVARAFIPIKKKLSVLRHVYVKLGVLSVDYIKLVGHDPKTGKKRVERIDV